MNFLPFLNNIDIQLLDLIREFALVHIPFIGTIVAIFADLEPILFGLFLIWLWLYGSVQKDKGYKHVSLDLFWHVMGAFALYWVLNLFLPDRPRPEMVSSLPPLINHLPDNSFPSGHAIFWWASWWTLKHLLNRPAVTHFFFWIGFITCLTRIIAGIHYPGDIVVGFFIGWAVSEWFLRLPHGARYRKYAHDIPLKWASYIRL